jgi:glutamate 5-kinase
VNQQMRDDISRAKRVVVKVGSSSLTTRQGGIDETRLVELVEVIAARISQDVEVVLVSSGAIAAGLAPLGLQGRPTDLATQQAAASVGQSLLVSQYSAAFAAHNITVGQVLLTAADVIRRAQYRNAQRGLQRLLELGVLPIVNENDTVATDEIRFGDNDRLAALVAHVVQADALFLFSDVDGLYNDAPSNAGAQLISQVNDFSELADVVIGGTGAAGVGLGGMATKVKAAQIATAAGIPVVLTATQNAGAALAGENLGTYFAPAVDRLPTRLLWLMHATTSLGSVTLDAGAVAAVINRRMSLLPAGITALEGNFVAGDAIDVLDQAGNAVARGIVSFDATELPALLGKKTSEISAELGASFDREVIHRDDLVVIDQSE